MVSVTFLYGDSDVCVVIMIGICLYGDTEWYLYDDIGWFLLIW